MVWKLVWKLVITVILCKLSNLKFKLGYLLDSGEIFIQPKQRDLHQYQGRYLHENPTKDAKVPQNDGWNVFLSQNGGLYHFTDWVITNQSMRMEMCSRNKAYCTFYKNQLTADLPEYLPISTSRPHPTLLWLCLVKVFFDCRYAWLNL